MQPLGPVATRGPALLALFLACGVLLHGERHGVMEAHFADSTSSLVASKSKATATDNVDEIKSVRARTAGTQRMESALGLHEGQVVGEYRLVGQMGGALKGNTRPTRMQTATTAFFRQRSALRPVDMHVQFPVNFMYTNKGHLGMTDTAAAFRESWLAKKNSDGADVVIRFLGAKLEAEMEGCQHVTNWMARPVELRPGGIFWARDMFAKYMRRMAVQDERDCRISKNLHRMGALLWKYGNEDEKTHGRRAQRFRYCERNNFFLEDDDTSSDFASLAKKAKTSLDAPIFSVLEDAGTWTLYEFVHMNQLTPHQIASVTRQILEGLAHMADLGTPMIHHMLTPHNIFIRSEDVLQGPPVLYVKLGNFGSAFYRMQDDIRPHDMPAEQMWHPSSTMSFDREYAPPELLVDKFLYRPPATSYDMFSFGYVFCFMVMGDTFDGIWPRSPLSLEPDDAGRTNALQEGHAQLFMEELRGWSRWSEFLKNEHGSAFTERFIRLTIADDPKRRPTPGELLKDPWLVSVTSPEDSTWKPQSHIGDDDSPNDKGHKDHDANILTFDKKVDFTNLDDILKIYGDVLPESRVNTTPSPPVKLIEPVKPTVDRIPDEIKIWKSQHWKEDSGCLPVCDECIHQISDRTRYTAECRVYSQRITGLKNDGSYTAFFTEGPYPHPFVEDDPENPKYGRIKVTCEKTARMPSTDKAGESNYWSWNCLPVNTATVNKWIQWLVAQRKKTKKKKANK